MLASPISQYFQECYSVSPLQNDQTSVLELTEELLRESERQSQNILDSHSSQIFQNQDSYAPFLEQPFEEKSELEKSIKILHETSQQFKKSFAQSIDRLETQLSQLVNIHRN